MGIVINIGVKKKVQLNFKTPCTSNLPDAVHSVLHDIYVYIGRFTMKHTHRKNFESITYTTSQCTKRHYYYYYYYYY